jgi:hypothetical protein
MALVDHLLALLFCSKESYEPLVIVVETPPSCRTCPPNVWIPQTSLPTPDNAPMHTHRRYYDLVSPKFQRTTENTHREVDE